MGCAMKRDNVEKVKDRECLKTQEMMGKQAAVCLGYLIHLLAREFKR